jgi:triosephosphate isomerase
LGHSERRSVFGDTDEILNKKVAAALRHGLTIIFCVGETLQEREANETIAVINGQLENGLKGYTAQDLKGMVIAYEPVWAIGTGKTATPEQAQEVHAAIRQFLADKYGQEYADATRILYGGSVKDSNVDEIMAQPDVDGALVGGQALLADKFTRIINFN